MAKSIVTKCKECCKEFNHCPSHKRIFCSSKCYWKNGNKLKGTHKKTTEVRNCLYCDKVIYAPLRNCNRKCYDKHRADIIKSRSIHCKECSNDFIPETSKTLFCSYSCRKENEKPEPRNCVNCGNLFSPILFKKLHVFRPKENKTCSKHCRIEWIKNDEERKIKIGNAFRGENHPNWLGGRSLVHSSGFRGYNWQEQRKLALERDDYRCVTCGMTNDEHVEKYDSGLEVHHIVKFHDFTTYHEANEIDNLMSLCKKHHKIEENNTSKSIKLSKYWNVRSNWKKDIHSINPSYPRSKLTEYDVMTIKRMLLDGLSVTEVSEKYNKVGIHCIYLINQGKTWKNILPLNQ